MAQNNFLNKNRKLLRRFYEPLVLLSVLDPTRGAQRPDLIKDFGFQDRAKHWRNFLDQLSFLCDSKKGGDTVTAIAAQHTVGHSVFWLASNSSARNKAKDHVEWILARLDRLCRDRPEETQQAEDDVLARCIEFSSCRVKTYLKFLSTDIKQARPHTMVQGSEDELLFDALQPFTQSSRDLHALCAYAYDLRRHNAVQILTSRHSKHEARGRWSDIRHNVGRLGSWTKAVKILIGAARAFPRELEGATVGLVKSHGRADTPPLRNSPADFNAIMGRMLRSDQKELADILVQSLHELNAVSGLTERFREIYSTFQPRPHAELLLMEHFWEHRFDFVHDDKYVGCSKPSCYCCDIYMKVHPGQFQRRPCHGNLWPNWGPPIPLSADAAPDRMGEGRKRPQESHTFKMLQGMLDQIRTDLLEQIQSRRPRRARLPDSTTGMSSVVVDRALNRGLGLWLDEPGGELDVAPSHLAAQANSGLLDVELARVAVDTADLESGTVTNDEDESVHVSPSSQVEAPLTSMGDAGPETPMSIILEDCSSDEEEGGVSLFAGSHT